MLDTATSRHREARSDYYRRDYEYECHQKLAFQLGLHPYLSL
jgi:hypothetical protein